MQQRNKDLPASAVHPLQDKFGQVIVMTGFTKQEAVALEILKSMIIADAINKDENNLTWAEDIDAAYIVAEKFCSYLENEGEKESGLIKNV